MSTSGDAAGAASAAQTDISHDLLGLGDISSSREGQSSKEPEVRIHHRRISRSHSVHIDKIDSVVPSLSASETEARSSLEEGLEEGTVKMKAGKEPYGNGPRRRWC